GQAHLERVTDLDSVGVSLRNGSTHPGVVEVHDGDNRLAGGDHLAFAPGADRDRAGDRRQHARVTQTGLRLGELRLRGGGLSPEGGDGAFGGVCLMGAGPGGIQGSGGSAHLVFERLYAGASCFQRGGSAVTVLLRSDALFGEREHALGVGGLLLQRSLSLHKLRAHGFHLCLRGGDLARGGAPGHQLCCPGTGDLRAQAGQRSLGGALLRLQFGGIQDSDYVPGLHRSALIYQQLLDAAGDLGADNNLVGIHGADEHQIAAARRRKEEVADGDKENESEKSGKSVPLTHGWPPWVAACGTGSRNKAAAIKSRTAARRWARRPGESGSPGASSATAGSPTK